MRASSEFLPPERESRLPVEVQLEDDENPGAAAAGFRTRPQMAAAGAAVPTFNPGRAYRVFIDWLLVDLVLRAVKYACSALLN